MSNSLDELNLALSEFEWLIPVHLECKFYYDAITKIGTQLNSDTCSDPFVVISREQYDLMADSVASKFYLSKSGKVKPIPIAMGMRKLLECSTNGEFRTIKDCMIFVDPDGTDTYQKKEINYD